MGSEQRLRDSIEKALMRAVDGAFKIAAEHGFKEIWGAKRSDAEHADLKVMYARLADDLEQKIGEAGYSTPPEGDLRGQLVRLGRELKACEHYSGYSYARDRLAEAKEDVKSDIGRAILSALGVE